MIAASISILLTTAAPAATTPPEQAIVVTGVPIQDKKDNLHACLARHCPPNEDIDASLALAEAQLVAGKYHEARTALLAALKRNKNEAMAYPIPVSDLYRANGRVAAHLGMDEDYYRSTWGIYNTLKKGLPNAVDRHYSAMMEIAEAEATRNGHDRARQVYRSIIARAEQDGRPDIAALAELRMIMRHWPFYAREDAIRKIAESTDPKTRAAQLEARLALARIAFEHKDEAKADGIVAELARYDIKKPILVYAPAWDVVRGPASHDSSDSMASPKESWEASSGSGSESVTSEVSVHERSSTLDRSQFGTKPITSTRMGIKTEDMWVDVGFQITPDGHVSDVKVLRSRGNQGWTHALLASIGGRRYTPPQAGSIDRMERYTYTSGFEAGTASHLEQHSPEARVEYFDLSDIAAPN